MTKQLHKRFAELKINNIYNYRVAYLSHSRSENFFIKKIRETVKNEKIPFGLKSLIYCQLRHLNFQK